MLEGYSNLSRPSTERYFGPWLSWLLVVNCRFYLSSLVRTLPDRRGKYEISGRIWTIVGRGYFSHVSSYVPRKCSLCSQGTIGRTVSLKLNCLTANNVDPINVHFRCKKSQKTIYYTHTEIDSRKDHFVNFPTQIDRFYSLPLGQAVASMYLLPKSLVK